MLTQSAKDRGAMITEHSIPWAKPEFWGEEQRYVTDALSSLWISGGPYVTRFENQFAQFNRTAHAVATSNGTTALHLAYLAVGIQPGDEVIVPGFAFMAAANVAIHMNAVPVFADVDPQTWCVTAETIETLVSARTKLIVPVHTYGNVCEMDHIMALASARKVTVIEDAAESFGSIYRGAYAGTFGALGTYSFHAAKTITTGEGGMVVTASSELTERMHLYRSQGMGQLRYWHQVIGHNFRLTNMQAAIGCAQLLHIEEIIAARKRMFSTYQRYLADMPGTSMQRYCHESIPAPWVIAVELDPRAYPQGRDKVMVDLLDDGIETRPGFYTPTRMSHLFRSGPLTVADRVSCWILALPSFPSLTEQQIETVCAKLKRLRH